MYKRKKEEEEEVRPFLKIFAMLLKELLMLRLILLTDLFFMIGFWTTNERVHLSVLAVCRL